MSDDDLDRQVRRRADVQVKFDRVEDRVGMREIEVLVPLDRNLEVVPDERRGSDRCAGQIQPDRDLHDERPEPSRETFMWE